MSYEYNKRWRLKNPDKRYVEKKRYYSRTAFAPNGNDAWTLREMDMVMKREMSDSELSKILGRSVGAIQKKRFLMTKKGGAYDRKTNL